MRERSEQADGFQVWVLHMRCTRHVWYVYVCVCACVCVGAYVYMYVRVRSETKPNLSLDLRFVRDLGERGGGVVSRTPKYIGAGMDS